MPRQLIHDKSVQNLVTFYLEVRSSIYLTFTALHYILGCLYTCMSYVHLNISVTSVPLSLARYCSEFVFIVSISHLRTLPSSQVQPRFFIFILRSFKMNCCFKFCAYTCKNNWLFLQCAAVDGVELTVRGSLCIFIYSYTQYKKRTGPLCLPIHTHSQSEVKQKRFPK